MNKFSLFLVISLIGFTFSALSQTYTGETGKADQFVKVHFDQIKAYDALHPADSMPKMKKPKPLWVYPTFPIDPADVVYEEPPREESPSTHLIRESSPAPDLDFAGLGDNGTSIPPDTKGVIGPNHLMVTLNPQVRIMSKTGTIISTVSLGAFWNELPGSNNAFDPTLHYDPYENRWIFVAVKGSSSTNSYIFLGVSENSDPTGNWYMWAIDTDPVNANWCDFPCVGFNKHWIAVSGNMFTNALSFSYVALWVFDKGELYAGSPDANHTRIVANQGFTIHPAEMFDIEIEDIYCVTNVSGNSGGKGYIRKYRITWGPVNNIILENQGLTNVTAPWADNAPNNGNISPQLGSSQKIDAGDSRLRSVSFKNGSLWFSHTIFLPANTPSRAAVQWWQLSDAGVVIQRGRIDDATATMFYSYPSIAVNGIGEVLVGYSSFSSSQYASSSYSFRLPDDPVNELRDPYLFKAGLAPYYKTYGGDRNRWGDYSATTVDPVNDLDFYTLQEYAASPANTWGTWWAVLYRTAAPIPGFSANLTTVPVTTGVNFSDESQYVPTSWLWTFEGGTPSSSTEQNPTNIIYNSAGTFDVTLTVTNAEGSNTLTIPDYITASTTILPEIDFSVTDTIACLGDTLLFTDLTIYNPVTWQWAITPETFSYVNGTSANSQNPEVVLNESGVYTVTLTATNPNGSNSLTKNDYIEAGGVPLAFEEDFESGFETRGWTIENPDNSVTWEIFSIGGTTHGENAARVNIRSYTTIRERDMLISPPIDLSPYSVVSMYFDHAYAQYTASATDSLNVYISADCMQTWTKILSLGEDGSGVFATQPPMTSAFVPNEDSDWCGGGYGPDCYGIDLTPWSGNPDVRIMFETYSFYGNNIYIDNIGIYNTVGLNEMASHGKMIRIYPNPTTGLMNIDLQGVNEHVEVRIMSMQGQLIKKEVISPLQKIWTVDLSSFPGGIYLIEMIGSQFVETRKVMLD
jgi:PKD repeat protein